MRPNDQIVTALLSSKANPASQADACAWTACTFCHCMDMSLLDMDSCWRLPWILFNQSLRDYWHVSKFPVVRASRWPTSPQHHLQVTIVSTTKDQALSGVRHGCRASVGRPTGSAGGKRDFLAFLAVRISTAVRLPALSIRQEHTSRVVAILNTIASIDGSKDASTGLRDDSA